MQCPQCGGPLKKVPGSNWLNADQYAAVKAGDYFCETCPDNGRGNSGLCYWWEREVEAHGQRQCEAQARRGSDGCWGS